MSRHAVLIITVLGVAGGPQSAAAQQRLDRPPLAFAAAPVGPPKAAAELSPEERMQRRFPQPVRVGDLIGLPLLDFDDRTLGYVQRVVETPAGKIELIVPYGGLLGWGRRPVAVPIEAVAIAGRQLAALDITRAELAAAPAWNDVQSRVLPASDIIRIGLYRR